MYNYPELSATEKELAFNVHSRKKNNQPIFQIDEVRRRTQKKKNPRKMANQDANKLCQCCGEKTVGNHRCDHTFCVKPCLKMPR